MQKPANLASLATRLNNLEQRYDENPSGEPGTGDPRIPAGLENLWQSTIDGAYSDGVSMPPQYAGTNWYLDNGTSMSRMVFSQDWAFENSGRNPYTSCLTRPFYEQVFAYNDDRFTNGSSLASTVLGVRDQSGGGMDYVTDIRLSPVGPSMIEVVLGRYDEGFLPQLSGAGKSMIEMILGRTGIAEIEAETFATSLFELTKYGLQDLATEIGSLLSRIESLEAEVADLRSGN